MKVNLTPPRSSVVVNAQGRESRGYGSRLVRVCGTPVGALRCPCGVVINTLVDLIKWAGRYPNFETYD